MKRTLPSHSCHSDKEKLPVRDFPIKPLRLTLPIDAIMTVMNGWQASSFQRNFRDYILLKFQRRPGACEIAAQSVRERFLSVKDVHSATRFFSRHGPLTQTASKEVEISMQEIMARQADIRAVREMGSEEYFNAPEGESRLFFESYALSAQLVYRDAPTLCAGTPDVLNAIRSANFLDHIGGVRAGTCPYHLCGRQFSWGPKDKKRTYCIPEHQAAAAKDRYNREHRKGPYAKASE